MNTTCRTLTGVWLIAALSHGPQASAERTPEPPGAVCVNDDGSDLCYRLSGRARFRHRGLSPFTVDDTGTRHRHEQAGDLLLRIDQRLSHGAIGYLHVGLQLFDGQQYGDESTAGGDTIQRPWRAQPVEHQIALRELYGHFDLGFGTLRIGRMMSHWGLGMLANGGDRENHWFADATHGDIVNRVLFATRPGLAFSDSREAKALVLALAGDYVERDELVVRARGDEAWQFVGSLAWQERDLTAGLYVAYRHLTRPNGMTTAVVATDAFARWRTKLDDTYHLHLQSELAFITGSSQEARFDGAPSPLSVLQTGWTVRADFEREDDGPIVRLDAGYASGDKAPQDGVLRGMRLDPGFKAGMILFEEVLARTSAHAYDKVLDPTLMAEPPHGVDRIATNGSVNNAWYLYPQLTWQLLERRLNARLGVLLAIADSAVYDPYASALQGGYPQNSWMRPDATGILGGELNLGVDYIERAIAFGVLGFRLGVHYGLFIPGPALSAREGNEALGIVHKWRILADLIW